MSTKTGVVFGSAIVLLLALAATAMLLWVPESQEGSPTASDAPKGGTQVGAPEPVPFVSSKLTAEERQAAEALALDIPEVADDLRGKRFLVVGGQILFGSKVAGCGDPVIRKCARVHIFNYTDGRCIIVLVDLEARQSLNVNPDGGCGVSAAELELGRQIAEDDPRVQQVIEDREGKYIHGQQVIPRFQVEGHRYVGVTYTLDGGTAAAQFVVDLTIETICRAC